MMQRLDFEHFTHIALHRGRLHRIYDIRDPYAIASLVVDLDLLDRMDPIAFDLAQRTYHTGNAQGRWRRYRELIDDPIVGLRSSSSSMLGSSESSGQVVDHRQADPACIIQT